MNTILIIVGVLAVAAGILIYLQKAGKIKDADGNLIPDVVEDKIDEVKEVATKVKARAKKVVDESKNVIDSVKVTPKKKRTPSAKK